MPANVTLYDRPSVALANLLDVDPASALMALVAPDKLPPSKRRGVSERILKEAKNNPLLQVLVEVGTDPMVILGMLLSIRFPPVTGPDLWKIAPKFGGYAKAIHPVAALAGTPETIFAGTDIPKLFDEYIVAMSRFLNKNRDMWANALKRFKERMGRPLSYEESVLIAAALDKHGTGWRTIVRKSGKLDEVVGVVCRHYALPRPLIRPIRLPQELEEIRRVIETMLADIWKEFESLPKHEKQRLMRLLSRYGIEAPRRIFRGEYFPHLRPPGGVVPLLPGTHFTGSTEEKMLSLRARIRKHFEKITMYGSTAPPVHFMQRIGRMYPSPADMDILRKYGYVDEEMEQLMYSKMRELSEGWRSQLLKFISSRKKGSLKDAIELLKITGYSQAQAESLAVTLRRLSYNSTPDQMANYIRMLISDTANAMPYSLGLNRVLAHYLNRMAPIYTWNVKGLGRKFLVEYNKLNLHQNRNKMALLESYLPMLQGFEPPFKAWTRSWWTNQKIRALAVLEMTPEQREAAGFGKSPLADMLRTALPESTRKWMADNIKRSLVLPSGNLGVDFSSYFYLTTLGLNPSSPLKNLFQVPITAAPLLGWKTYAEAQTRLAPKIAAYVRLRASGVPDNVAMARVFPDFVESGLAYGHLPEEIAHIATVAPDVPAWHTKTRDVIEKIKHAMMAMFTESERYNRLLAFEMGLIDAEKAGFGRNITTGRAHPLAIEHAHRIVRLTQFSGGVAGTPRGLLGVPTWARQFMHFPVRYLEFLGLSTKLGTGVDPGPWWTGGRRLGTIGRVMAASAAIYRTAKELTGIDLSGGLLFGALPLPQYEESPFYPFPVVPPVFAIGGNLIKAAAQGDVKPLKEAALLAVPAGIMGKRVYQFLSPRYADYRNPTPDGRIPVYTPEGTLIGYRKLSHLVLKAAGFRMVDDATEPAILQYLIKQRDIIREYRRRYMEAFLKNDVNEMMRIQDEFHSKFPELGYIHMKLADIKAYQKRINMTRLARAAIGIPKEYRDEYIRLASTALGPGFFEDGGAYSPSLGAPLIGYSVPIVVNGNPYKVPQYSMSLLPNGMPPSYLPNPIPSGSPAPKEAGSPAANPPAQLPSATSSLPLWNPLNPNLQLYRQHAGSGE